MENVYQIKDDRSPSPFWNINSASGSGSRHEPLSGQFTALGELILEPFALSIDSLFC